MNRKRKLSIEKIIVILIIYMLSTLSLPSSRPIKSNTSPQSEPLQNIVSPETISYNNTFLEFSWIMHNEGDYLYSIENGDLKIYDLSNPDDIIQVGSIYNNNFGINTQLCIRNRIAFVFNYNPTGLLFIINCTDFTDLKIIRQYILSDHFLQMLQDWFLYTYFNKELVIYNFTNYSDLEIVCEFSPGVCDYWNYKIYNDYLYVFTLPNQTLQIYNWDLFDLSLIDEYNLTFYSLDFYVIDNYLFFNSNKLNNLFIYNVTDFSSVELVSIQNYTIYQSFPYMTVYNDLLFLGNTTHLEIYSIYNIMNVILLCNFSYGVQYITFELYVNNNYLFMFFEYQGVVILDVSIPHAPKYIYPDNFPPERNNEYPDFRWLERLYYGVISLIFLIPFLIITALVIRNLEKRKVHKSTKKPDNDKAYIDSDM